MSGLTNLNYTTKNGLQVKHFGDKVVEPEITMQVKTVLQPAFVSALNHLMNQPIPVKTAVKLRALASKINQHIVQYDTDRRALLNVCGEKNEDGRMVADDRGNVKLLAGKQTEYVEKLEELQNREIQVQPFASGDFGDACVISANQLIDLGDLLEML